MIKETSMYGLVNKAMKDLINERFGEEQWQCICHEAGADASGFISLESYPDEMSCAVLWD